MNLEATEERAAEKAKRREKKLHPKMKVSGRGMKRFASPKRTAR